MDLAQAIRERKSIRAFTPVPLSRQQVEEILSLAILAPSAINLQPWEFTVVMGEEKARLSRTLIKAYREKQISCSPGNVKPLSKTFSRRGVESFEVMNPCLAQMGTDFGTFINEGSCNFYGAPAAILITLDSAFSRARLVDIGITLGYLALAAHEKGLGTCPIGLINAYEEEVKDLLNIADSKDIVIAVALGYPDWDSPVNSFKTPRDSVGQFVRWID